MQKDKIIDGLYQLVRSWSYKLQPERNEDVSPWLDFDFWEKWNT